MEYFYFPEVDADPELKAYRERSDVEPSGVLELGSLRLSQKLESYEEFQQYLSEPARDYGVPCLVRIQQCLAQAPTGPGIHHWAAVVLLDLTAPARQVAAATVATRQLLIQLAPTDAIPLLTGSCGYSGLETFSANMGSFGPGTLEQACLMTDRAIGLVWDAGYGDINQVYSYLHRPSIAEVGRSMVRFGKELPTFEQLVARMEKMERVLQWLDEPGESRKDVHHGE